MSRRRDREIFSRQPRKRGFSKWAIGAATILVGLAIAAPSVAAKDCQTTPGACAGLLGPETAIDRAALETATVEVGAETREAAPRNTAKHHRQDGRRKVAGMTLLGLLFGGGGTGAGIGMQ